MRHNLFNNLKRRWSKIDTSPRGGARIRVGSVESFHAPTWGSSAVLLRCEAVILRCEARCRVCEYQRGRINKGRSPQNCMKRGWVSAKLSDAILRDDELICFASAME